MYTISVLLGYLAKVFKVVRNSKLSSFNDPKYSHYKLYTNTFFLSMMWYISGLNCLQADF